MFNIGDVVTMSLTGTRWCTIENGDFSPNGSNPFGVEGTVIQVRDNLSYLRFRVEWDNGRINSYSEKDLVHLKSTLENE